MTTKIKPSVLADTAVSAGTYGGTTQHAVYTVDQQGRITYATNATPSIANTQITGLITSAQIVSVANTQLTGTIVASQLANTQTYGISVTGSAGSATGSSASLTSGLWTVSASGTKLSFIYNGTTVFSVDSSGNIIAKADVSGYGTP